MDYQHSRHVFLRYTKNNLEYLIQNMVRQFSFHMGADILKLLLLYEFFYVSPFIVNAKIW